MLKHTKNPALATEPREEIVIAVPEHAEEPLDPEHTDQPHDEEMDHEIREMMGEELLGAIESKDKKQIMDGIEAIVMSMMSKERK